MDYKNEVRRLRREREKHQKSKRIRTVILLLVVILLLLVAIVFAISNRMGATNKTETESNYMFTPMPDMPEETTEVSQLPTTEYATTPHPEPTHLRGTAMDIPENIRVTMDGYSMPKNASITYSDLSYLTIPHYDYNYNIVEGHLVVNKELAEEVLDIFADLFDIKYPIERMELIDQYGADDYISIDNNNTSAFNYRESTDGSGRLSKHALGRAIDINPQINPYVNSNGTGAHSNAKEYWSRDRSAWTSDIAKASYIGPDTEIYKIFVNKYGWEWGGSWSTYRDYQHFQKNN